LSSSRLHFFYKLNNINLIELRFTNNLLNGTVVDLNLKMVDSYRVYLTILYLPEFTSPTI
jgi:hypothetical protein